MKLRHIAAIGALTTTLSAQSFFVPRVTYHGTTNAHGMRCTVDTALSKYGSYLLRAKRPQTAQLKEHGYVFMFISPTYSGALTNIVQIDVPIFCWVMHDRLASTTLKGWQAVIWYQKATFYAQTFQLSDNGRIYWSKVARIDTDLVK
tara:strand:- start:8845 stop:9285 length:441 start_codon:yes stop_codon:yes gene_type:complete